MPWHERDRVLSERAEQATAELATVLGDGAVEHDTNQPTRPAEPHEQGYRNQTVPLAGDPTHPWHWGPRFDHAAAEDVAGRARAERAAHQGAGGVDSAGPAS